MSAGVHDSWIFGCERQAGLFLDLERIEIRPQRDGAAGAFPVDRDDDAIAVPDVRLHINRFIFIETGDERSRFLLVERQFRMLMEMTAQRNHVIFAAIQHFHQFIS